MVLKEEVFCNTQLNITQILVVLYLVLVLERRKLENIFPGTKPHENRLYNPVGLRGFKFSILVEFRFCLF